MLLLLLSSPVRTFYKFSNFIPAAAIAADLFANRLDFLSIGTNDLIQYTLAVDRGNERVASLYSAAHPSVIQLIKDVLRTANRTQTDISLCGEMAGEPEYVCTEHPWTIGQLVVE